ncbi:MAG: hypothetical protein RSA21_02720 [Akkermansia sp.]
MLIRALTLIVAMLSFTGISQAVHVVMTGGPALKQWEGLRIKADRHDNWWANFVRASTIRLTLIQRQDPKARITWVIYKPGYITRSKEDQKPYTKWIADLAHKYKVKLVWVNTSQEAINALNKAPRSKADLIESFYYFGHSNCYAFMLDYGNEIMGVSKQWIHETDLGLISPSSFMKNADCWSYGCYTGASMSHWWNKIVGIPLWGNMQSTNYGPVSNGTLPSGGGKWVNGK